MRFHVPIAQVERNYRTDAGKSYITLRELSSGGGVVELNADASFDTSVLAEGTLVSVEGEARGYSFSSDGHRSFGLRLLDARVRVLPSLEQLLSSK